MYKTKRFGNYGSKQLKPDLTPLIDVVFLLLIFFMVATTFDDLGGMKIELPKSDAVEVQKDVDKISVLMDKDGVLKIKSMVAGKSEIKDTSLDKVSLDLQRLLERSRDKGVGILADRDIDYGNIVDIMSKVKESGATSIDIQANKN